MAQLTTVGIVQMCCLEHVKHGICLAWGQLRWSGMSPVSANVSRGLTMAHDKQAKQVLEADMGARALMEQEQSMRRLATVVLEGPVLHMGDFVVRLALPAQRPGAEQLGRFLLVTVEYLPLLSWHAAQPVLEGFAMVLGQLMHTPRSSTDQLHKVEVEWTSFDLPKDFGMQHLALQLSHLLMRLCRP